MMNRDLADSVLDNAKFIMAGQQEAVYLDSIDMDNIVKWAAAVITEMRDDQGRVTSELGKLREMIL